MEELWKDMSLTSTPAALQYHLISSPPAAYLRHDRRPQPPLTPALTHTSSSLEFTYLGHAAAASSNSTSSGDDSLHHMPDPFGADIFSTFAASGGNNNNGRLDVQAASVGMSDNRRQRRIIKNRESAARSRARKQAYTNELELELTQLRRENAMLVKRQQEVHVSLQILHSISLRMHLLLELNRPASNGNAGSLGAVGAGPHPPEAPLSPSTMIHPLQSSGSFNQCSVELQSLPIQLVDVLLAL